MFSNRKKLKIQGKTPAHKKQLVKSQITELIRNTKIKTTPAKAKLLKATFDKLVNKAKSDSDHSKRYISSFFASNQRSIERFYSIIESYLSDRTSGYTRVFHTLPRKGDGAKQVYVLLVNTEAKSKTSKIKKVLQKQEEKKDAKSITKRVSKVFSKVSKGAENKSVSQEQSVKTRRNSM